MNKLIIYKRSKTRRLFLLFFLVGLIPIIHSCKTTEITLQNPDNISKSLDEYPFLKNRARVKGFIENASQHLMSVSISPPFCPSYSYTSYRGYNPNRSLGKCNDYLKKELTDYTLSDISRCKCKIAIRNMKVINEDLLMQNKRWVTLKLFHKDIKGVVSSERGFLEYETIDLVDQNVKILNKNLKTVCESKVKFSIFGKNNTTLSCFGGTLKLSAKVWLETNPFSPRGSYILGSGLTDKGSGLAFISGLTDEEILKNHPEFIKNISDE